MGNIQSFTKYKEENTPHIVNEVICLKCYKRWVAVRPQETNLADLECPQCGKIGYAICTGQDFNIEE